MTRILKLRMNLPEVSIDLYSLGFQIPTPHPNGTKVARGFFALVWSKTNHFTVQKTLRDLKSKISSQSKKNFVLEKDVRYLDSRIALLIQNRMALEEVSIYLLHSAFSCTLLFFLGEV